MQILNMCFTYVNKILQKTRKPAIGILLFLFGAFFSAHQLFYSDFSLTVLSHNHNNFLSDTERRDITPGKEFTGEITAEENYLGIISIRFEAFDQNSTNIIRFSIQEATSEAPFFSQDYESTFLDDELHHFGFVPIVDSKGKQFIYTITALKGKPGNAIWISDEEPIVVSKYKIPKQKLLSDYTYASLFLIKKITYEIQKKETIFHILTAFIPFFFYLFFPIVRKQKSTRPIMLAFFCSLIILDIVYIHTQSNIIYVSIIGCIYVLILGMKQRIKIMWLLWLAFYTIAVLYYYGYNDSQRSEWAMSWAYLILIASLILLIKDYVKK